MVNQVVFHASTLEIFKKNESKKLKRFFWRVSAFDASLSINLCIVKKYHIYKIVEKEENL